MLMGWAVVVGVRTSGKEEEVLPDDEVGVNSLISKMGTKSGAILRS